MWPRAGSRADRFALAALSAVLLALPVHREAAWPVGGVSLIPLLAAARAAGRLEAAALGAFTGVLYGTAISLWIPAAVAALGVSRPAALTASLVVSFWAVLPVFAPIGIASRAAARWRPGARALALASVAFAVETAVARAWWGVPFGLLGASQRGAIGVAQLAVVGGVPLITALLVAVNALWADLGAAHRRATRLAAAVGASWLALAIAGLPVAEAVRTGARSPDPIDVLIVQPNLPRAERWGDALQPLNLERVRAFAERALAAESSGIDALVLPENLVTAPVDGSPELAGSLAAWARSLRVPILTGVAWSAAAPDRDLYRSAVVWLEPARGITARLDKERAIPLLESSRRFPGDRLLAPLFGAAAEWKRVEESAPRDSFTGPISLVPLLCYEVLFPDLAERRRGPSSAALVNLADDGWLRSREASRQLTQLARFRAIEQRLALVRVAQGGLSAVVDEFGRVREELPVGRYAARRATLYATSPATWRERAAILALPGAAFAVAIGTPVRALRAGSTRRARAAPSPRRR